MPISRNKRKKPLKKKKHVSVKQLLNYLPDEVIADFASESEADKHVKRLSGLLFFKLLLYGVLKSSRLSTHLLESYYNSEQFSHFSGKGGHQTRHSSIADRLKSLPVELFEKLFSHVSTQLEKQFSVSKPSKDALTIRRFDSTMVVSSAALLKEGMIVGKRPKQGTGTKHVKFSIGLSGDLPVQASTYSEQAYLSEDKALAGLVLQAEKKKETVLVFDRGIAKRSTYDELTTETHLFVTRINTNAVCKILKERELKDKETDTLHLQADLVVKLQGNKHKWTKHSYRFIKTISKESGEEIWFLSNMKEIAACQITEIYRQRWQIEVFFKFLKQHLAFNHLLSYELDAIKIMLYVRLIAAALMLIYKRENGLSSYKIAVEQFRDELEMELIKYLIDQSGGNSKMLKQLVGYQKFW